MPSTTRSITPLTATMEQCVPVPIFPDSIIEEDEFLTMRLTSGDAVDIVQSTVKAFIRDDEGE